MPLRSEQHSGVSKAHVLTAQDQGVWATWQEGVQQLHLQRSYPALGFLPLIMGTWSRSNQQDP